MDGALFLFSHHRDWCHSLSKGTPLSVTSGGAGNNAQFPKRSLGFNQLSSLQKQSRAWEDKWSREKALYGVLTKQKLKGIFGTRNRDLYGMIPRGKVKGRDSGRQKSRVHGNSSLHWTFHTRPAHCISKASVLIMLPGNQANCHNSSGWMNKTGIYDYQYVRMLQQSAVSIDTFWATEISHTTE